MALWDRNHTERSTVHPWRWFAALLGLASLALGVWALTRTGLDLDDPLNPERTVLGMGHTPALALAEIVAGVFLLLAAMSTLLGSLVMALVGIVAAAFGLLIVTGIWDEDLQRWTAVRDSDAWVYLAAGVAAFVAATVLPTISTTRVVEERTVDHDHDEDAHHRHHWWQRHHAHT